MATNSDGSAGEPDGNALQINPEVLRGKPLLPDLDKLEVVLVQRASHKGRWIEGVVIHLVGTGAAAAIAFIAGLMFAGTPNNAEGAIRLPASCSMNPAAVREKAAESASVPPKAE
jgi:hypothetical protein